MAGETRSAVAFIDPVGSGGRFGAAARALGALPIAVLTREFDDPYIASSFVADDYAVVIHHESFEATERVLRREGVTAVVPAFETGVGLAEALAEQLDLLGNPTHTGVDRSHKASMKAAWAKAGVACAAWTRASSADAAAEWAARNGLPVVVKPEQSGGGFNVFVCHTLDEVRAAYGAASSVAQPYGDAHPTVLVEEYLDGDEYFVDLVHAPGEDAAVLCLAKYDKIAHPRKASICRGFRSLPPDTPELQTAIQYAREVSRALEFDVGVNDTEFKLTPQGPRVIEVNNRLPGAMTPAMIEASTGVSPHQEVIFMHSGLHPQDDYPYNAHFAVCCLLNPTAGTIDEIHGLDEVRALESFHSLRTSAQPGDFAPETLDLLTAWGMVGLVHADSDQLDRDIERVHQLAQLSLRTPVSTAGAGR